MTGTARAMREAAMDCWTLLRSGSTLRIEARPKAIDDLEDIAAAVERSIDDSIDVVRVSGPLLEEPRTGLTAFLRRISDLAGSRGKRFQVGPI